MDSISMSLPVLVSVSVAIAGAAYVFLNQTKKTGPVLDPKEFKKFPLIEKIELSHNSALYRFGLPKPDDVLGLPIGQHISIMLEVEGKQVLRSYTPTSSDLDIGHFDLVIKAYPDGIISRHISELKIGDTINVRGPKGAFKYSPNLVKNFGMIAGGTGITPMFQVAKAILANTDDETKIDLIFANVSEDDILLRKELDEFSSSHSNRFQVHYVLNNAPTEWSGSKGFVTKEIIQQYCPSPSPTTKILLCGPPPMVKAVSAQCEELGFDKPRALSKMEDMVFKF